MINPSSPDSAPAASFSRLGSLYYLFTFLAAGAYMPFLFVHFSELGISGQQIGWISILSPLVMLFLATPIAALADRRRWRVRILQIAVAGQALILYLLGQPRTFGWIAVMMLLLALIASPISSLSEGLVARMARRHGVNFGSMRLWGSLGYAASALGFGALWGMLGFAPMFVVSPLFLLPLLWLSDRFEEPPSSDLQASRPALNLLGDTGLFLLLLATFLAAIANSLSMTFGGIYARALEGGDLLIGMMIAFSATAETLTMFLSEHVQKRLHGTTTLLLAYGLMAVAYLGWVFIPNPVAVLAFSIVKGLGYGLWIPVTVRMTVERTPETRAATAQSFLAISMFGLAPLVAGPVGGWIHDAISAAAVFGLGVLSLLLASIIVSLPTLRAATTRSVEI